MSMLIVGINPFILQMIDFIISILPFIVAINPDANRSGGCHNGVNYRRCHRDHNRCRSNDYRPRHHNHRTTNTITIGMGNNDSRMGTGSAHNQNQ